MIHGSLPGYSQPAYQQSSPIYSDPGFGGGAYGGGIYGGGIIGDGIINEGSIIDGMPIEQPSNNSPTPAGDQGSGGEGNQTSATKAVLQVSLPAEAKVFVNGQLTTTPGSVRKFVSRDLDPGASYAYELKAVLGDGRTLTKVVDLKAGQFKPVSFNFEQELITSVIVHVPHNARLNLAGKRAKAQGPIRYFSTRSLKQGQTWDDYTVEISYEVDGKVVTESKSIPVTAGESHEIRFDQAIDRVAAR